MERVHFQNVVPTAQTSSGSPPTASSSPASSTKSTISSRCSCSWCDKIISTFQRVWSWFKEKILRIKKEEPALEERDLPALIRLARYEGNLVADFKKTPAAIIKIKNETPLMFLEMFVEQVLRDPTTFFTETLTNGIVFWHDGSEKAHIADFINGAGSLLGREGEFGVGYAASLFPNDPTIKDHVQLINNYLASDKNQDRIATMKNIYRHILGGDEHEPALN